MKKYIIGTVAAFIAVTITVISIIIFGNTTNNENAYSGEKDTLLIYMVGSDLEARSGAGSDDLKEIENSGVDLNRANVLVYAGGTPKWHNEIASSESNTILQLKDNGFEKVSTTKLSNMGEADTLLEFLDYAYKNYPSKSFSLIMWDHGNGPVIGYGKDMLFDNDSLTLNEMKNALERSAFKDDNKFEWVGFDACLMSSVELVCVWDDYANYLIASQEVEPAFGWNYSFLKDYNIKKTTELLPKIVDDYIDSCLKYYQKRKYDNRDTTLSCIDLSKTAELESAINSLFNKANNDIATDYNKLVAKRANTRALGRASTGSEYDLIDLEDMASQLSDIYPKEADAVCQAIKNAVIKNGTNAKKTCGISIYYPFYNKYHYENAWKKTYGELNVFESYISYLEKYQKRWLTEANLDSFVSDNKPYASISNGPNENRNEYSSKSQKYYLNLTKEQNENYAKSRYYILKRLAGDMYLPVFACDDVENNSGILTAHFEGKAIYLKNKFNDYYLPLAKGYDMVDNISRYSISAWGENKSQKYQDDSINFQVSLDNKTQKVNISSITVEEANKSSTYLGSGRAEDRDINDWDSIRFVYANYSYLKRYNNGTIAPLSDWTSIFALNTYEIDPKDGLDFTYSSLDDGDYYIIFEITDTTNNKYCSELLKIDVNSSDKKDKIIPKDININWSTGEKIKLFDDQGIKLYLDIKTDDFLGTKEYVIEATNENDHYMLIDFSSLVLNSNICLTPSTCNFNLDAKETDTSLPIVSSSETYIGSIDKLNTLSFTFTATKQYFTGTGDIDVFNQTVNVKLSDKSIINFAEGNRFGECTYSKPFKEALAKEQILLDNKNFKITLNKFGYDELAFSNSGYLTIENKSNKTQHLYLEAICVNGITLGGDILPESILPGCKAYVEIPLTEYELENNNISSIESLKLCFGHYTDSPTYIVGADKYYWADVKLDKKGKDTTVFKPGKNIIFNKNGVKIYIDSFVADGDSRTWNATVVNDSDSDIALYFDLKDFKSSNAAATDTHVGAKQRKSIKLTGYQSTTGETLIFKVMVLNFAESSILFTGDDYVTLSHK